jgi:hypothetical protein
LCSTLCPIYPEKVISGRDAVKIVMSAIPLKSENCLRAYESTSWIIMGQIRHMMAQTP